MDAKLVQTVRLHARTPVADSPIQQIDARLGSHGNESIVSAGSRDKRQGCGKGTYGQRPKSLWTSISSLPPRFRVFADGQATVPKLSLRLPQAVSADTRRQKYDCEAVMDLGIRVAGQWSPPSSFQASGRKVTGKTKPDASYRMALLRTNFDTVNSHPDPVGVLLFFTPPPARYARQGAFGRNRPVEKRRTPTKPTNDSIRYGSSRFFCRIRLAGRNYHGPLARYMETFSRPRTIG